MTAIDIPIKNENTNRPTSPVNALAINATDKVIRDQVMILLLEPRRLTNPIIKLDPAKQISGIAARIDIWVVFRSK